MPGLTSVSCCVKYATCFIAMWLLPLPLANADPSANSAVQKKLEDHVWRVPFVIFESSAGRGENNLIVPGGESAPDAYLSFKNGEIGGNLGCGELTGRYDLLSSGMRISATWADAAERCGYEFRKMTEDFIAALNGVALAEETEDGSFHLFDAEKTYFVFLQLLSPGIDLSETRYTYWRLVKLEENTIAEANAEIRLDEGRLQISLENNFSEEYSIRYNSKKLEIGGPFSFAGTWSIEDQKRSRNAPPIFEKFEKIIPNIKDYTSSNDKLAAFDSSGRAIMLLERIHSTGLEHRFWHIQEYTTAQGTRKSSHPKAYMITFAQGSLEGMATCTGYAGEYTVAGDSLSVRARERSLFGRCPQSDRDEDHLLVDALNKASRIKEDGPRMLLQDAQGNTSIVLAPYAQPTPH